MESPLEAELIPIQVTQLGLAAYIRMNGSTLVKVENRVFHFASTKTTAEWRTEYSNSESMRHDSFVCDLREFLKTA